MVVPTRIRALVKPTPLKVAFTYAARQRLAGGVGPSVPPPPQNLIHEQVCAGICRHWRLPHSPMASVRTPVHLCFCTALSPGNPRLFTAPSIGQDLCGQGPHSRPLIRAMNPLFSPFPRHLRSRATGPTEPFPRCVHHHTTNPFCCAAFLPLPPCLLAPPFLVDFHWRCDR